MLERIWITWAEQRRNNGVAAGVGAHLYTLVFDKYKLFRYPLCIFFTLYYLFKDRPIVCFAMLPSIFCTTLLSLLKNIIRYKFVIDLHTLNIYYLLGPGIKKYIYNSLLNYCLKTADLIIVSNKVYVQEIDLPVAKTIALPDPIPEINQIHFSFNHNLIKQKVLFITSFDPDEPLNEMFTVGKEMSEIDFFFSGNYQKLAKNNITIPKASNIVFTGFLPMKKYHELLSTVNSIVVLTNLEGCLCCGAYEAFAVSKPLILSSTIALKAYFGDAPIYTKNDPDSLKKAIKDSLKNQEKYCFAIRERAETLKGEWVITVGQLNDRLKKLVHH